MSWDSLSHRESTHMGILCCVAQTCETSIKIHLNSLNNLDAVKSAACATKKQNKSQTEEKMLLWNLDFSWQQTFVSHDLGLTRCSCLKESKQWVNSQAKITVKARSSSLTSSEKCPGVYVRVLINKHVNSEYTKLNYLKFKKKNTTENKCQINDILKSWK